MAREGQCVVVLRRSCEVAEVVVWRSRCGPVIKRWGLAGKAAVLGLCLQVNHQERVVKPVLVRVGVCLVGYLGSMRQVDQPSVNLKRFLRQTHLTIIPCLLIFLSILTKGCNLYLVK